MIASFLHNLTLIVTLTFIMIHLKKFLMNYSKRFHLWMNAVFVGLFTVAVMLEQFRFDDSLVDLRSLPLILFTYIGGWRTGVIAALFPAAYRYYQGGEAVEVAILSTIVLPVLIGSLFHRPDIKSLTKQIPSVAAFLIVTFYYVLYFFTGVYLSIIDLTNWIKISASSTIIGLTSLVIMLAMLNTSRRKNRVELELEKAVVEREAVLQSASEISIITVDLNGLITSFNPGSEKMLGFSSEEVVGKQTPAILHSPAEVEQRSRELSEQFNEPIEGMDVFHYICKQGKPETRLWTYIRKDGTTLTVRLSVSGIYDYNGHIGGFLGVGSDMTKEIQLREELNEQYELLEAQNEEIISQQDDLEETLMKIQNHRDLIERIIEANHEAIVMCNEAGVIQYANQKMHEYFGFKPEYGEQLAVCCEKMKSLTINHNSQITDKVIKMLNKELDECKEKFVIKDTSGQKRHYEVVGTSIQINSSTEHEYLFVFYNETERMELDEMKDDLISVISHELRTPMASILGFVEILLNREVAKDKQRKYLEIVYKETNRLTNLLNDFLDIQRMESSRQEYQFGLVDLTSLVHEVVEQWQNKPLAINLIMPNEEVLVEADVQKMTQVLHNLVSNAVKYSPGADKVDIRISTTEEEVSIDIKDYGLGIPEKDLSHLFTKFFRVEHSDRMQIGGTGLGLSICREIIKAHQGEISVNSNWGEGSTFTIHLKRAGVFSGEGL